MTRRSRSGVRRFGTSSSAHMGRDVADAHVAVGEHHHRTAHAGELRQHLGVARIVIAGLVERLLVERRGDDRADPAGLARGARPARWRGRRSVRRRPRARRAGSGSPSGPAWRSTERRPIGILGLDLGDVEFGRELRPRLLQRSVAADHHELRSPAAIRSRSRRGRP